MGDVEGKTHTTMGDMANFFNEKKNLEEFVKKMPAESLGLFFKIMLKMSTIGKIDVYKSTTEEKIKAGNEIKEIANSVRELVSTMEKLLKQVDDTNA